MNTKNRSFNVAGISHYSADFEEGELVYFELEPSNPYDSNAIKVLNESYVQIGYVPKDKAVEINDLLNGGYPHYCARIKEVWEGSYGDTIPKVLAHFANKSTELPYSEQNFVNLRSNYVPSIFKIRPKLPIALNCMIMIVGILTSLMIWAYVKKIIGESIFPIFISIGYCCLFLSLFIFLATEKK
jgi:hypothetical protein